MEKEPQGKGGEAEARAGKGAPDGGAATADGEGGEGAEHGLLAGEAEAKPGDDLRRFNENVGPMLEGMDGLVQELARTGSKLDSLREAEAKRADAGNAGASAEAEAEEDAPDGKGGAAEMADFYRWVEEDRGRRRRWSLAAMAVAAPAAFLLGVLVQHQFQALPPHDPSGGWNGWIWEMHGRAIVDCAAEAMRTNAEVDCPLVVRRP